MASRGKVQYLNTSYFVPTRYLQDFNETVYNLIDETNATDMESVAKLAWNPLAAYRTFWRFENYVKTWLKRESEDGEGQLIKRES